MLDITKIFLLFIVLKTTSANAANSTESPIRTPARRIREAIKDSDGLSETVKEINGASTVLLERASQATESVATLLGSEELLNDGKNETHNDIHEGNSTIEAQNIEAGNENLGTRKIETETSKVQENQNETNNTDDEEKNTEIAEVKDTKNSENERKDNSSESLATPRTISAGKQTGEGKSLDVNNTECENNTKNEDAVKLKLDAEIITESEVASAAALNDADVHITEADSVASTTAGTETDKKSDEIKSVTAEMVRHDETVNTKDEQGKKKDQTEAKNEIKYNSEKNGGDEIKDQEIMHTDEENEKVNETKINGTEDSNAKQNDDKAEVAASEDADILAKKDAEETKSKVAEVENVKHNVDMTNSSVDPPVEKSENDMQAHNKDKNTTDEPKIEEEGNAEIQKTAAKTVKDEVTLLSKEKTVMAHDEIAGNQAFVTENPDEGDDNKEGEAAVTSSEEKKHVDDSDVKDGEVTKDSAQQDSKESSSEEDKNESDKPEKNSNNEKSDIDNDATHVTVGGDKSDSVNTPEKMAEKSSENMAKKGDSSKHHSIVTIKKQPKSSLTKESDNTEQTKSDIV